MAGEAIGHGSVVAFLKNTGAWGGYAAVAGALHGVDVDAIALAPDSQIIERMGATGKKSQFAPQKGSQLVAGDIGPMDFFYDGCQRFLAQAFGIAGAPTTPSGGTLARQHVFKMADSHKGIYGTLVQKTDAAIREWPCVKLTGFALECESGGALKLTPNAFADTVNYNIGILSDAAIVASVTPANGDLTLAGQPTEPSPLRITLTDGDASITELKATIIGEDVHGDVISVVWTKTIDGNTFDTKEYFASVTKITLSALAGTATGDTIKVGVTNGKNNDTSVASITLPADRTRAVFPEMKLYANDQSDVALAATHVKGIRRLRLSMALNLLQSVTTKGKRVTDEPLSNGFSSVELGFSFERWSTVTGDELNHDLVKAQLRKGPKKVKVEWLGPVIEAIVGGAIQYRLTFYLNNVVFTDGDPKFTGPGQMALEMTGRAYRAVAVPTGFPAGYTDPAVCELVNKNTADALGS